MFHHIPNHSNKVYPTSLIKNQKNLKLFNKNFQKAETIKVNKFRYLVVHKRNQENSKIIYFKIYKKIRINLIQYKNSKNKILNWMIVQSNIKIQEKIELRI